MSFAPPAADPHAAYEAKLQEQGYQPLPEFAVIDECQFRDKKTGQQVNLDKPRLERMAQSQNRRIEDYHAGTPVILGHTTDDRPEDEQPPVVGMATRFRVAPLPNGRPALWARPWAKPGVRPTSDGKSEPYADTFKKNFRRSVELWLDPDAIDPIALLGPTTPRRDLPDHLFARQYGAAEATTTPSVVRFSRANGHGRHPILFEMRADMDTPVKCDTPPDATTTDAPAGPDDELVAKFTQSAAWKELTAKLDKVLGFITEVESEAMAPEAGPDGAPPAAPPGSPAAPPGAAPEPPPPAPGAGSEEEEPEPDRAGPPKKNSAGAAAGYGNTSMPSYDFERDREFRVRMQRVEADNVALKRQVSEREAREKALADEVKALRFARTSDAVTAVLDGLAREGFVVVPDIDHRHLCGLAEADRDKAVQFMRETRAKKDPPVPGGDQPLVPPGQAASLQPFRFERVSAGELPGDPSIPKTPLAGLGDFARMAAEARSKGIDPLAAFDAAKAPANGVAATPVR